MTSEEKTPFAGSSSSVVDQPPPIYNERTRTKTMKIVVAIFLAVIVAFLALTVVLTAIQAARVNTLYIILLVSLLAFAQLEVFVVYFIYTEKLSRKCFWAIFVVGVFVIVESISTDILVFQ